MTRRWVLEVWGGAEAQSHHAVSGLSGRSSKVEAEEEDEVWTVAVQREFSMSWSQLGYPEEDLPIAACGLFPRAARCSSGRRKGGTRHGTEGYLGQGVV